MMQQCLICHVEHDECVGQQAGPFWGLSVVTSGGPRVVCRRCVQAGRDARRRDDAEYAELRRLKEVRR